MLHTCAETRSRSCACVCMFKRGHVCLSSCAWEFMTCSWSCARACSWVSMLHICTRQHAHRHVPQDATPACCIMPMSMSCACACAWSRPCSCPFPWPRLGHVHGHAQNHAMPMCSYSPPCDIHVMPMSWFMFLSMFPFPRHVHIHVRVLVRAHVQARVDGVPCSGPWSPCPWFHAHAGYRCMST